MTRHTRRYGHTYNTKELSLIGVSIVIDTIVVQVIDLADPYLSFSSLLKRRVSKGYHCLKAAEA
jgi:hypothetical protein